MRFTASSAASGLEPAPTYFAVVYFSCRPRGTAVCLRRRSFREAAAEAGEALGGASAFCRRSPALCRAAEPRSRAAPAGKGMCDGRRRPSAGK